MNSFISKHTFHFLTVVSACILSVPFISATARAGDSKRAGDFSIESLDLDSKPSKTIIVSGNHEVLEEAEERSFKAAFEEVQDAVDSSEPGDTIVVCPGTYGPFVVDDTVSDIRIVGFDAEIVAEDPDVTVIEIRGASGITLDSLEVHHNTPLTCSAGCIFIADNTDVTITNCDLHGSGWFGILVNYSYRLTIKGNRIHDCTDYGFLVVNNPWQGEYPSDPITSVIVADNYFYNNEDDLEMFEDEYFDVEGFY
jgi:parallel beta-helix repeat protein